MNDYNPMPYIVLTKKREQDDLKSCDVLFFCSPCPLGLLYSRRPRRRELLIYTYRTTTTSE